MDDNGRIVYVVTSGCYSSYGVSAVFSTREKAEAFIGPDPQDKGDGYRIEEYYLDPADGEPERHWRVEFTESGDVAEARDLGLETEPWDGRGPEAYWFDYSRLAPFGQHGKGNRLIVSTVRAKTKEHAVKIASEQRAMFLAEVVQSQPQRKGSPGPDPG